MQLAIGRIFALPNLLKLPELVMVFVMSLIARYGNNGDYLGWTKPQIFAVDGTSFGDVVCYGFFLILLVQIIGIVMGDEFPIQNTLLAGLGFIFFMTLGIMRISTASWTFNSGLAVANGVFALLASLVFAAEAGLSALGLKNMESQA